MRRVTPDLEPDRKTVVAVAPSSTPDRNEVDPTKVVTYQKSKILDLNENGLDYLDDEGLKCSIDFRVCRENVDREVRSPGWVQVRVSDDVYMGFRDSSAKPPRITLASTPPTRFNFPMPGPPKLISGGKFYRHDPEDFRDFWEFLSRLSQVGAKTLDLS